MKENKKLPDKTVERLSQYRRNLLNCIASGKAHIFSHEIANLLHITSVQVRRDIMLIGYKGTLRKGYDVQELINLIGEIIDSKQGQNVAVIGVGNLGRALISYFKGKRSKLLIVAAFDTNPEKVDRIYAGVHCYHYDRLAEIIKQENISIGIITVPASEAAKVAENLVIAGISGILNFSPSPVNVSPHVFLEEYDMITSLEKVAYFVKKKEN
ncbi:MAG: redox-sensing transcriptional repressor Rex [Bacteroidales bacterium]